MQTYDELLNEIDLNYKAAREAKLSRTDLQWAIWSRKFNVPLQQRLRASTKDGLVCRYILNYWINRSQLLDVYYRYGTLFKKGKKRELIKMGKRLREIIKSGEPLKELSEKDIMNMLVKEATNV